MGMSGFIRNWEAKPHTCGIHIFRRNWGTHFVTASNDIMNHRGIWEPHFKSTPLWNVWEIAIQDVCQEGNPYILTAT